ncbi:MAG: single-stranded DNA-binding protein [Rhodospirillales bacterium]|nr:single-stranded DNA-binding protein [Rhodospirillales bacterium]
MSSIVTIEGPLVTDPEIRYSRDGVAHTTFGVRCDVDRQDLPQIVKVAVTGDLAENVALSLTRDMGILAAGWLVVTEPAEGGVPAIHLAADTVAVSLAGCTVDVHRVVRPVA